MKKILLFALIASALALASCKGNPDKGPMSGGPCEFRETPGTIKFIKTVKIEDSDEMCRGDNFTLTVEFTPDDPAMSGKLRYPVSPGCIAECLSQKDLDEIGDVVGKTFKGAHTEDISYSCPSPEITVTGLNRSWYITSCNRFKDF